MFALPTVKTKYVDIPNGNGQADLSEVLTGEPMFNNRVGSFEFTVIERATKWNVRYSDIANYLHGQYMAAVLEDDPGFYYDGIFDVNQWASSKHFSKIVINYSVCPFKKPI